jgi:predicted nucleic acid-binding protein
VNVLLDLNILLDVVLAREPFVHDALAVCRACADGRAVGFVAAFSVSTLFYVVEKSSTREKAFEAIDHCLASFEIATTDRFEIERARSFQGIDFEDNLQIACAMTSRADGIVTRNKPDFASSPVPVWMPAEFLGRVRT